MPRKKKAPPALPINGITADPDNKLLVKKSRPLFALWKSDLTLPEFKILDMYLARINTRHPEYRTVILSKGELEKALGVSRINLTDLENRLKHLYQPINLARGKKKSIDLMGLFERAQAEQDEDGQWKITLTCTESAMEYIFKAEEIGYLRYKLRCITSLTSRYSYILFCYLEDNRFRKSWDVKLEDLKVILNCADDESYAAYKVFNDRILKRCHKELLEKTDCKFSYTPQKNKKKVVAIHFELETLPVLEPVEPIDPNQLSLFGDNHLAMLQDAFADLMLSDDDLEDIYQHLITLPEAVLPLDPGGSSDIVARRAHYLRQLRLRMKRSKNKIPHPVAYICVVIDNDAKQSPKANGSALTFGDGGTSNLGSWEREAIARMIAQQKAEADSEE